jgi:hypothetical protein
MSRIVILVKVFTLVALILVLGASMPPGFLTELTSRYDNYKKKYPFVILSLSFNQPSYIPGDSVFFSAKYLYEDLQFVKGTHLIRLDILAQDGSTWQTIRFKITDGIGDNQLVIRTDIKPGIYKVVAYSEWMRNFGPQAFFQMNIPIVGKHQIVKIADQENPVEFYPEGGYLIKELDNRIVVKGSPNQEIVIRDESNINLNTVKLNAVGIGSFVLRPEANKKYFGFSILGNVKSNLPDVLDDGVTVKLDSAENQSIIVGIATQSQYAKQNLFALILAQGNILLAKEITFNNNGLVKVGLPSQNKTNVLHQLFILDSRGKEVAQRVFMPRAASEIKVKFRITDQAKQRNRFTFAMGIFDGSGSPIESDLSLSIIQNELFKTKAGNELPLCGLASAQTWANENRHDFLRYLNDYLVSEKWNRIDWESIYNNKPLNLKFPFRSQITFSGSVFSKDNNRPVPDSTQVIAYLQKNTMGYEAYTKDGNFDVPIAFDFWGDDVIFYTIRSKGKCLDERYSIKVMNDTVDLKAKWRSKELSEEDPYAVYGLKRNLINRSYTFFSGGQYVDRNTKSLNGDFEDEFPEVDHTVRVTDYVVFPTMDDLIREIVSFVQLKKKGSESSVRLYYRYEKSVLFYKHDPIYIIDGVMSSNTAYFLSLRPEDILSIKIINDPNKLAQLGNLGENGFIMIESKKGNLAPGKDSNLYPVTGLSRSVWKPRPELLTESSGIKTPDLRSTLYWNPRLKSDLRGFNEITLLTSDDAGPMKIKVHGVTYDGRIFTAEQDFKVELNPNRP